VTIDYREFRIQIRGSTSGELEAQLLEAPSGLQETIPFTLPIGIDEIDKVLATIESLVRSPADGRELEYVRKDAEPVITPEELGSKLFEALIAGEIRSAFDKSLGTLDRRDEDGNNQGLRIRICFNRSEDFSALAALPWELLCRSGSFLCRRRFTPVIRYLGGCDVPGSLEIQGPLRILVVESSPKDLPALDAERERQAIKEVCDQHPGLAVKFISGDCITDLRDLLLDEHYHVLHFIGHGDFLRSGSSDRHDGVLLFTGDDGLRQPIAGTHLSIFLQDTSLRLVVLNSCRTGAFPRHRGQDPFTGVAAALSESVPAVVAMQFPISDPAAIAFSKRFYRRLSENDPVEAAVTEGRLAILERDPSSFEWVTPVLFLSTEDSRLFQLRKEDVTVTQQPTEPVEAQQPVPLHLGIRSFSGAGAWGQLEEQSDEVLDLTRYFDGRWILDDRLWDEKVFPEVRAFLLGHVGRGGQPLVLDFAAHSSIAFAAGYCLEVKSGLDITVLQRTLTNTFEYRAEPGPSTEEILWEEQPEVYYDPQANDVAFAIGVTHDPQKEAEEYLKSSQLDITRLVPLTVPKPSTTSVRDGLHALQLAQWLVRKVRQRSAREREGTLHLFMAAPNAFVFFLGQLSRSFGPVQLYEHDFHKERGGPYWPSIRLPQRSN
jgi:hypothetical protein